MIQPVEVQSGRIMAWFDEKGGGIQYEFKESISELLKKGVLKKVGQKNEEK